jgi:hypothetical protein
MWLTSFHRSLQAGHLGYLKTVQRAKAGFFIFLFFFGRYEKGYQKMVKECALFARFLRWGIFIHLDYYNLYLPQREVGLIFLWTL